jgi:hypothetical protein
MLKKMRYNVGRIEGSTSVAYSSTPVSILHEMSRPLGALTVWDKRRRCTSYRLRAAGTFQEASHNAIIYKRHLSSSVIDKQSYEPTATKDLSHYLNPVREISRQSLEGVIGKDPSVLDPILKNGHCIVNVEVTESFRQELRTPLTAED